jgi:hypothetical protein
VKNRKLSPIDTGCGHNHHLIDNSMTRWS